MNVMDALVRELKSVREQDREVVRVRVTPYALAGSVVAVPLLVANGDRRALLTARERWREVLVHPNDWVDVVTNPRVGVATARLLRVMGVEVVHG